MADDKYLIISYCTCVFAVVLFAVYAVVMHTRYLRRRQSAQTAEEFITARGTATRWRIAWSFFASAVGSWCIVGPSSFAVYTGIVGLVAYAVASGFPVLAIAVWGGRIQVGGCVPEARFEWGCGSCVREGRYAWSRGFCRPSMHCPPPPQHMAGR